jgi:hypothetical protein
MFIVMEIVLNNRIKKYHKYSKDQETMKCYNILYHLMLKEN